MRIEPEASGSAHPARRPGRAGTRIVTPRVGRDGDRQAAKRSTLIAAKSVTSPPTRLVA
jgi:hypothetical protein